MKERKVVELNANSVVEDDVYKRIHTTGVRGLSYENAKELGFFTRISNLLCASHASIMAAYRIYGGVDYLLSEYGGKRNEIAKAMNEFEKAFIKFTNFWTDYYASGSAGIEMGEETEILFRRIMQWAQLPMEWNLGDKQRVEEDDIESAIHIAIGDGKEYIFNTTIVQEDAVDEPKETWCVTKYDTLEHVQKTVEEDMDKASAMMVAKRLSTDDPKNIYTASVVQEIMEHKVQVVPYKAYKENKVVGKLVKQFKQ